MQRRELGKVFYAIKRFVLGLNLGDRGKKILLRGYGLRRLAGREL